MTKTLTLPLIWEGSGLRVGPFFAGLVAQGTDGRWLVRAERLLDADFDGPGHPKPRGRAGGAGRGGDGAWRAIYGDCIS